jgi:16S rRNA (guanine527-N7)-methyltransferase
VAAALPDLSLDEFRRRLEAASPVPVAPAALAALFAHYQELRRWNPSLSLVGPAAVGDIVERHYAESLAGVPLVPRGARTLVDVGSGAGFPGFVLAAALPEVEVTLVEPRQRRWSFLLAASRRAALPCRCLDARVDRPLAPGLPESIDVITTRALKLPPEALAALADRLAPGGRVLVWAGEAEPEAPPGLVRSGETAIAGSRHRRIVELTATGSNQGPLG